MKNCLKYSEIADKNLKWPQLSRSRARVLLIRLWLIRPANNDQHHLYFFLKYVEDIQVKICAKFQSPEIGLERNREGGPNRPPRYLDALHTPVWIGLKQGMTQYIINKHKLMPLSSAASVGDL